MLNKAIEHGKEKRKRYYGPKAYCYACCNHRSCEWCRDNRLHKFIVSKLRKSDSKEDDYESDGYSSGEN